ncbi:MAG: P-loop ATPase, Sll1717 family [Angustibacter sp.]
MVNPRESLQFGEPAAEREGKKLEHYFVENRAFERLHSGPRRILLGNRGSGKSAVFRMLAERDSVAGNIAISLAPQDYSYEMLKQISASRVDGNWGKSAAYAAAWKYLMMTLALRRLARVPSLKQRPGKDEKTLQKFLNQARQQNSDQPLDVLLQYLQRFEDVRVSAGSSAQRTSELARLYELDEIAHLFPLLSDTPGGKSVHIYVDELDLGWDGSEEAQAFVTGLFQASLALNKLDAKLRVYIAIRQELFNSVPALNADAQKYRDMYEQISWESSTLFTLITRRIEHFFPHAPVVGSRDEVWRMAFTDLSSYRFMLERSLYRPRELIIYCTEALEYARQHRLAIPMSQRTVEAVEARVSKDRLDDITSEHQFQYPSLDTVLKSFANGPIRYDRERLLERLMELSVGDTIPTEKMPGWASMVDPSELLDTLWRIGFLGVEVDARSKASGNWRPGSPDDPSVDIDTASHFSVLPMFHKALKIGRV